MSMAKNTRIFTDLDLNFIANPVTGDVGSKYDENAIKQSVKNLILTKHFERPFHPEIGSQVYSLLFDNITPLTHAMMEQAIRNTIDNHEPRVRLTGLQINLNSDNLTVYIAIEFIIVNTQQPVQLAFTLRRTR
jgi:phage baseplate assembly protein W